MIGLSNRQSLNSGVICYKISNDEKLIMYGKSNCVHDWCPYDVMVHDKHTYVFHVLWKSPGSIPEGVEKISLVN